MNNIICVAGPTASGKTALAVELAGSGLTEEERETFYKALELITLNLQKLGKEGLPQR